MVTNTKANAAYYGTTGSITFENGSDDDDYTAAVSSFALVPTYPSAVFNDIGGGSQPIDGTADWVANVEYAQDWTTADSFSQWLLEHQGETISGTYTPQSGGAAATCDFLIRAGQMGGAGRAMHSATVTLPVTGQPVVA